MVVDLDCQDINQLMKTFVTILLSAALLFYRMNHITPRTAVFNRLKHEKQQQQTKFNSMNAMSFPHFLSG